MEKNTLFGVQKNEPEIAVCRMIHSAFPAELNSSQCSSVYRLTISENSGATLQLLLSAEPWELLIMLSSHTEGLYLWKFGVRKSQAAMAATNFLWGLLYAKLSTLSWQGTMFSGYALDLVLCPSPPMCLSMKSFICCFVSDIEIQERARLIYLFPSWWMFSVALISTIVLISTNFKSVTQSWLL